MSNKLWRTLIRFERIDSDYAYAVIPAWRSDEQVKIALYKIPKYVVSLIKPIFRCHARVNIGADSAEELQFAEWETD